MATKQNVKFFVTIFTILLAINLFSQNINDKNVFSYFKEELSSINNSYGIIVLKSTYAKLRTAFGKKKFKLKSYKIKELGNHIYKLTLNFYKKKKIFRFREKKIIYFFYNDSKIVFLTEKGKFKFGIMSPYTYNIIKMPNGYKIVKKRMKYFFKILVQNGKVYLYMEL